MSSIFLSHTSTDKPFVRKLANDLMANGHTVWIDEAEINIGDSLIEKIRDGLDSVDYVAAVLSKASIESPWVQKELEIASNREIKEKEKIVLPIIIEEVPMPGFLEGKFYGDFTDPLLYDEKLTLLLRSLGDTKTVSRSKEELERLKEELEKAKAVIKQHVNEFKKISEYTLSIKSESLRNEVIKENKLYPEYAPINNVYAFEVFESPITLGYLLHATRKATERGTHPLDIAFTMDNKWQEAYRMLEAYSNMILAKEVK